MYELDNLVCEECPDPDPGDFVIGCADGVYRCQSCCIEDGFSPLTGENAENSEEDY